FWSAGLASERTAPDRAPADAGCRDSCWPAKQELHPIAARVVRVNHATLLTMGRTHEEEVVLAEPSRASCQSQPGRKIAPQGPAYNGLHVAANRIHGKSKLAANVFHGGDYDSLSDFHHRSSRLRQPCSVAGTRSATWRQPGDGQRAAHPGGVGGIGRAIHSFPDRRVRQLAPTPT